MPYQLYLHRRFDIQLSPVAASIIDWAPPRRDVQVGSDVAPSLPSSSDGKATARNTSWNKSFCGGGNTDDTDNTVLSPQLTEGGLRTTDGGAAASPEAGLKGYGPTAGNVSEGGSQEACSGPKTVCPRLCQGNLTLNSYAAVPLLTRGSFSLNAGLLAGFGIATGTSSSACSWPSLMSPPTGRPRFYATDTLQLEWIWRRMQWAGEFKLLCRWPSTALPVCEVTGVTPRTDWCVQTDRLLFNWSGFWRVFVRDGRRCCRDALGPQDPPLEPSPAAHDALETSEPAAAKGAPPAVRHAAASPPPRRHPASAKHEERHHPQPHAQQAHHEGSREKAAATAAGDKNARDDDRGEVCGRREGPGAKGLSHGAGESRLRAASGGESYRWWRLKELRGGAGFAVKNDLASGVNVYCGCTGHLGRALTVSSHVDVLRRACCSITSTTKSLDLAARLRINLITWHRTELDVGVGWRPFKQASGLTCRLSRSMGRTSVGITINDVGTQYNSLISGRHVEGEEHTAQTGHEGSTQRRRRDSQDDKNLVQESFGAKTADSTSFTAWLFSDWHVPYVGRVWRLAQSLAGSASLAASSAAASPATGVVAHNPGLRKRLSQIVPRGLECADALFRQTEFDLTVGLEEERHNSRRLRGFVVLSAH
ncbi:uncharacterized protein Tco025E_00280 [Trypanosoma conorhini]|uniref:Uncharacterized protein n=1 Tax=Trypanosoma conorhini TaxID=83891 RepID=A0A3R7LFP2_9TRYP|nr:uncharacterized protein Tco025E_00280 [Trypanosoma conorhini]RNF27478.1 hypothetical protein Tco025E_00280 [Trypanosoma conorhini]